MAGGFRLLPLYAAEQYFRQTPEGWLFGAPRPWLSFGPRLTYLVTDQQKATLSGRILMWRSICVVLMMLWMFEISRWRNLVPGLTPFETVAVGLGLFLLFLNFLEYLMVRPLVAGLAPATERMTIADTLQQQSKAMSIGSQAILGSFCAVGSILSSWSAREPQVFGPEFWEVAAVIFGGMSIFHLGSSAVRFWRSRRVTA